jgi:hypothetical protein
MSRFADKDRFSYKLDDRIRAFTQFVPAWGNALTRERDSHYPTLRSL